MSVEFTYRGQPIRQGDIVTAVLPVRSIKAADGLYYRGVLDVDSRGNAFVHRGYPDGEIPPQPVQVYQLLDSGGNTLLDSSGNALYVRS